MSTRQVKRMQQLETLAAFNKQQSSPNNGGGGDEDTDDDEEENSDGSPTTMMRPSASRKQKKNKQQPQQKEEQKKQKKTKSITFDGTDSDEEKGVATKPAVSAKTKAAAKKKEQSETGNSNNNNKSKKSKAKEAQPPTSSATSEKKKKQQKRNVGENADENDDDEAFELALKEARKAAAATVSGSSAKKRKGQNHHVDPTSTFNDDYESDENGDGGKKNTTHVQYLICDSTQLDPRSERIRNFGPKSVEDLRPKHAQCPKFRKNVFISPDPNTWAPFDPIGLKLERIPSQHQQQSSSSSAVAVASSSSDATKKNETDEEGGTTEEKKVTTSSAAIFAVTGEQTNEYRNAQNRFESVANSLSGNWQELIAVWRKQPYHLPTLLQLAHTFQTMGDIPQSQTMVDYALFSIGALFAAFPFSQSSAKRQVPYSIASNKILFRILTLGMHNSLKKGCARTALELGKFIYSLDETDPMHVFLILDYVALRCSQFSWLASLYDAVVADRCVKLLPFPSLHFNAALARFFSVPPASDATTHAERQKLEDEATEILIRAVQLFPNAFLMLAERAGVATSGEPWSQIRDIAVSQANSVSFVETHLSELNAERSADVWKAPKVVNWMTQSGMKALAKMRKRKGEEEQEDPLVTELREMIHSTEAKKHLDACHYKEATKDGVMGTTSTAIPQELLEMQMTPEEQRQQMQEQQEAFLQRGEIDELQRYQAVFGALGQDVPVEQQMAIYREMLHEQYEQDLGEDTNAVAQFFQTLMPWNTTRDMALRRAMEDRGVEDPVAQRRREERRRANENMGMFVQPDEDVIEEGGDDQGDDN